MPKYLCMHKVDAAMEAGARPTKELIADMGRLIQRMAKAGQLLDGNGLHRSASRARVRWVEGAPVVERGPYAGGNEVVAHITQIATTGIEAAIELGTHLGEASGQREVEIGPVVETWDLHESKRPADAPFRYLLLVKADAAFERGEPLTSAVATLEARWKTDGILQAATRLAPSKRATRYRTIGGTQQWTDGPFAEAKEMIAGYVLLELATRDEAQRFVEEYAAILGETEVDVRELA